jgi:hypothetical protein
LPDGEDVVSTTCLRFVAVAREAALGVIELRPINSATTEANTIVLEASITEAIPYEKESVSSCSYNKQETRNSLRTFAFRNTFLHSHIVRRQSGAEDESIGITRAAILKATGVDKGLKLVQTRRQIHVPGMRGCHE